MPKKQYDVLVDAGPAREHIEKLCDGGMSCGRISELSGVSRSRVESIRRGNGQGTNPLRKVRLFTATSILAVAYEPRGPLPLSVTHPYYIDPLGTRRRLQAMCADGFSSTVLIELLGVSRPMVYRHTRGDQPHVHERVAARVADGYERLLCTSPADAGMPRWLSDRIARIARGNGFAPRMCWDADTIDDPRAEPEWTGECGTMSGYRVHCREDIPVCEPCAEARRNFRERYTPEFDYELLKVMREKRGISQVDFSVAIGRERSAASHWERGRSAPSKKSLTKIAAFFDMSPEQFYKHEEA